MGFLSRPHGYDVLKTLVKSADFQLLHVYTHKLNPKSQDPLRNIRDDFYKFEGICKQNNIPLTCIDSKNDHIDNLPHCDYIVEVSWRYMIPKNLIKRAKYNAFGIHRGKLPEYAGAEPIKQALKNNEKEIILSAHNLDAEIDKGNVFDYLSHPVNYDPNHTLDENIQRLRDEITPLFSKLVLRVLDNY